MGVQIHKTWFAINTPHAGTARNRCVAVSDGPALAGWLGGDPGTRAMVSRRTSPLRFETAPLACSEGAGAE